MDFSLEQTIAALASAPGTANRAIIRVSGPDCRDIVGRVFRPEDEDSYGNSRQPARHSGEIHLRQVRDPLPSAAYFWPTTRSYTGQPLAELHLTGAVPLVEATLHELYSAGAEPARAGEFTLRAFLARRIDLLQAEAVLGVIDAPDEENLQASLKQLAGGVSGAMTVMHEQLLMDLADLEAGLDFVEEDIEFVDRTRMQCRLRETESMLHGLQQQTRHRMHAAPVVRVVLAGLPNAGKSTLFNVLMNSESALVSSQSGTTRDYLTGRVSWGGREIELVDTAGYDRDSGNLNHATTALREEVLSGADIVVWCSAADLGERWWNPDRQNRERALRGAGRLIPVTTKIDLVRQQGGSSSVCISARSGEGVEQLREAVLNVLDQGRQQSYELIGSTAARCANSIALASAAVLRARQLVEQCAGDELVAAEMRVAVDEIGRITGRIHGEDILDRIFSKFCIGK